MHLLSHHVFIGKRASRAAAVVLAGLATLAVPAGAVAAGQHGNSGLVPIHGKRVGTGSHVQFKVIQAAGKSSSGGGKSSSSRGKSSSGGGSSNVTTLPLTYHGGSIFSSRYTIHNIYWVPTGYTVSGGYQTTIDAFAENLSAAAGSTTNVFDTATQYTDSSGNHVANAASFGGSTTVSTPLPASGCSDSAITADPCLSDVQVASEIQSVAVSQGWSVSYPNIYVIMMPQGVGNCSTTSTGSLEGACTFSNACAWHHQWGGLYFMVVPDPATSTVCGSGESPSGEPDADSAINLISHELNETLTDPAGGSWYDANGDEMADKCSWNFGTALGGSAGHLYNQLINGVPYFLQQEWSNATSRCVLQGT